MLTEECHDRKVLCVCVCVCVCVYVCVLYDMCTCVVHQVCKDCVIIMHV